MADDTMMAEGKTLSYHGFVETYSRGNPVLARATNDEARERAKRENSGGVIFLTEDEMPSLTELLAQGGIKSAVVIEAPPPAVDEAVMRVVPADWRAEARQRLAFNLEIADRDDVMDESYVFLAALPDEQLEASLARAHHLLEDEAVTEERWLDFLDDEAERADKIIGHQPISFEKDEVTYEGPSWEPLIPLKDLGIIFTGGAMGGPRPLADLSEP
jgi:hypothetical protein